MAAGDTTRVVVAALGANALIAVSKFVAASITGAAAMLSEALWPTRATAVRHTPGAAARRRVPTLRLQQGAVLLELRGRHPAVRRARLS
jgi:hypothetical protein